MSDPVSVDVNLVLKKLQARLAEAYTTIALLEAQLETVQASFSEREEAEE